MSQLEIVAACSQKAEQMFEARRQMKETIHWEEHMIAQAMFHVAAQLAIMNDRHAATLQCDTGLVGVQELCRTAGDTQEVQFNVAL